MAKLFRDTPGCEEGKYLVIRRDGTVVEWPHFVMGARDPIVPWALRVYALVSVLYLRDLQYAASVWRLARDFRKYRKAHGAGDPNAPRHRPDDAYTIARMRSGRGA
jgi:hypothetical protein